MSEQTPKIDPRYRPEFQRGGSSAPPALSPESVPPVVTVGMPPAPPTRTAVPPAPPVAAPAARPTASEQPVEFVDVEPVRPSRWLNPFIIVLWVLSMGLIFTTVSVFQLIFDDSGGFRDSGMNNVVVLQMAYTVAPYGLVLGVAGIIGLLFWHASTWRRWQQR